MLASPSLFFSECARRTLTYASAFRKKCLGSADHLPIQFLLLLIIFSCNRQEPKIDLHEIRGEVFGSYYHIKYRGDLSEDVFRVELSKFFKGFNDEFSTYQENSVISRFNRSPKDQPLRVSGRFIEMLEMAQNFYKETDGAFDPTLGPVIKAWGFGGGQRKSEAEIKKAREFVGFSHIHWDQDKVWKDVNGVQLDVNAFAPGWAADLISGLLHSHHIENFMVDISGEILFQGMKANDQFWIGGIEKPSEQYADGVHLALKMKDAAIATSGNYRQYFDDKGQRKSHIIDPRTGAPVAHSVASATVITTSAARADAWSTAMMVLGEEGLAKAEKNDIKVLLLVGKSGKFDELLNPGMKTFVEATKL